MLLYVSVLWVPFKTIWQEYRLDENLKLAYENM